MKKLLSMILALAMLVSLVPAAFANDTETQAYSGVTVRYDLTLNKSNGTYLSDISYDLSNGFWARYSTSATISNNYGITSSRLRLATTNGNWVALEINVPKAGKYDVKMTYTRMYKDNSYATENGKVWILPLINPTTEAKYEDTEITAALNASDPINKDNPLDFYNNNGTTNDDVEDDNIGYYDFPSAGTYLVVFKATEASPCASAGTKAYMYIKNITLDGDGNEAEIYTPMSLPVSVDKTNLSIDSAESKTAQITVGSSTYMSNGDAATVDTNSVSYTSSDKNVATVSETGLITAKSFGQATITTTATVSTDTETYTVSASTLIDVGAAYSNVTVKYNLVKGPGYDYSTEKLNANLRAVTFITTNDFWGYHSQLSDRVVTGLNGTYARFGAQKDDWSALVINVPKAGVYDVWLKYATRGSSNAPVEKGGMWILPLNNEETGAEYTTEEITAALTGVSMLGNNELVFAGESNADNEEKLQSYYFENAGTYLVIFKCLEGRSGSTATGYMFPGLITLDGEGDGLDNANYIPMTLGTSLDKAELTLGSETEATAQMTVTGAYMSDCGTEAIAVDGISYASGKESVATVAADGKITAVATGSAAITASATATSGETSYPVTASRTITVVDKVATDEVTTVEFMATSTLANSEGVTTDIDGYTAGSATSEIEPGKTVVVTANDVDGYIFRGWKRGSKDNGVWVSESKVYSFPLLTNTYLTAIYDVDTATDAAVNVEFYNFNGQFITSKAVNGAGFGALAEGVTPTLTGYNSFFWTIDGENAVAEDKVFDKLTRVVAKFADKDSFAVTVPENVTSDKASGTYEYDTEIAMSADNAGVWKVNGKQVAYGENYTYTVWSEATITFEEKANDNKPIISLDTAKTDGARMISYAANGAEIVEAGILFGAGAKINSAESRAVSRKARGNVSGQFTAKPYDAGDLDNATAYLIYNDNGTYRVIYAN